MAPFHIGSTHSVESLCCFALLLQGQLHSGTAAQASIQREPAKKWITMTHVLMRSGMGVN